MNVKRSLESRIKGWLPKEVSFPATATAQINPKPNRQHLTIVYVTIFAAVFVTVFITYGISEVLGYGSYSSYASAAAAGIAAGTAITLTIRRNQNPNTSKRRAKQ
jgi:membrane associated rhomboid family serine protease